MISSVFDALSFLTILPFSCPISSDRPAERMARALGGFPLAGAVVGAVAGGCAWFGRQFWGQAIGAWFGLAAMAIVTGGLHLDGFSDTMDGLGAWKNRDQTVEVMKDSRIGVMGAVGLILLLAIQWSALRQLNPQLWIPALVGICSLSRLGLAVSAQMFPYMPGKQGIGRLVTDRPAPIPVACAVVSGFGIAVLCLGVREAAILLASALAVSCILNLFFMRWLGGITGDTLGALHETVLTILLLVLGVTG